MMIVDAETGARTGASSYHAGVERVFTDGKDVFGAEGNHVTNHSEYGYPELYAYERDNPELALVEMPEEADGCYIIGGGGGYFLCSKGVTVYIMKSTP
jgi:hypothetical protein